MTSGGLSRQALGITVNHTAPDPGRRPGDCPTSCGSREFERDVRRRVAQYFIDTGVGQHADFRMISKSLILGILYFGSYALLLTGLLPWPLAWMLCITMGVGLAGLGFCVGHDALHGAYSANPQVNRVLGLVFEALGGNGDAWRQSHNGAHHGCPNVSGHDKDVDVSPLIRLSPHSAYRPVHRFQHLYAFGLYSLATLNWAFAKDYAAFASDGALRIRAHSAAAWARLLLGKLAFYLAMAVPFLLLQMPLWQVGLGLLTVHLTAGLIVGTVFQLAHTVEGVEHMPASGAPAAKAAWAAHQLRTTSNFATGSRLVEWYIGGLNYQVEHHLFPRICHVHYPKISPIVRAAALEHGLPYNRLPSLRHAIAAHCRMLQRFGRPAEATAQTSNQPSAARSRYTP